MRTSAALLIGFLFVVSVVAGVGAGHVGDEVPQSSSALPNSLDGPADPPTSSMADSPSPRAIDAAANTANTAGSAANTSANTVNASENVTANDATTIYVSIRENGNAKWKVTAQFPLKDDNETAAFHQLADDYEAGTADRGFAQQTFARFLAHAASDTDRSMALEDVSRSSSLRENGTVGTLSLSFMWTNFTQVQGNRLILGDVFWAESVTWLPSLTADQSLTIEGPDGYYIASANVPHNSTRINFEGPQAFEEGDFAVTYAPKSAETTTETTTTTTTNEGFPSISNTSGLLVVLLIFGIGFGAYAVAQRRGPDPDVTESGDTAGSQPAASSEVDSEEELQSDEKTPTGRDDQSEDETDSPPTELLSDEERVLRLLREQNGRMKQADIVTETNWSNAKVSQLLSKMNDNDEVNKLRIGRENLITLPDEDVTDFD